MSRAVDALVELNPTQIQFAESDAKHGLMVAGMGAGKSHGLRAKLLRRIEQNHRYMSRKSPGVYLAPTYDMISNLVQPNLMDLFDSYRIPHHYKQDDHLLTFTFGGRECHMRLLSAENYDRYMGPGFPFILGDEIELCFRTRVSKIEVMWKKMLSRLRVPGATNSFDIAGTPEGFGFFWEWWESRLVTRPELAMHYQLFRASTYENADNLPPDYINDLMRDYDPQRIKAYIFGEFVNLTTGAIYSGFRRDKHVARGVYEMRDPDLPIEFCFDFNVNPMTIVVTQYQHPRLLVLAVLQPRSSSTEDACHVALKEFGHHRGPCLIYGDATGKGHRSSGAAGRSDRDIIGVSAGNGVIGTAWHAKGRGYDTRWMKTNPWQPDRHAAVNAFVSSDRLLVDEERGKPLVTDLVRQTYREGTREEDDQKGTLGHAAAALGYRIFRDWKAGPTIEERMSGKGRRAA